MKNIAIASADFLKEGNRLTEKLDELAIEHTNVRFLMSSLDPSLDLVQEYALNKFHLIHVFAANWSKEINADLERDKKMMNEASMLIIIDDSRSNRIKLLYNWADEKQIPIYKILIEPNNSQDYIDVLKLKIVNPQDQAEIDFKINLLESSKEQAVNNRDFEMAAMIRDKIRSLLSLN